MKKEDIIAYIEMQDSNLQSYKKENKRLRNVIKDIHSLSKTEWIKPGELNLSHPSYSAEEIEIAFLKSKQYEGLETNKFTTVLDSFIEFLKGTHHSLKNDIHGK